MTVLIKYLFVESFLAVCKKCKCDPLYSKWRKESFTQVDIADTESEVFMTYNNAWLLLGDGRTWIRPKNLMGKEQGESVSFERKIDEQVRKWVLHIQG